LPSQVSSGLAHRERCRMLSIVGSCRRRHLVVAAPLLFIPWRGCSEGGFYDTGGRAEQSAALLRLRARRHPFRRTPLALPDCCLEPETDSR
jgi:hypothetical protein